MAEKRVITSDIWQDEWFGSLKFFEKLLWIGLFSKCADDQGRMLDNPTVIRAMVFPYDDIPVSQIDDAIKIYDSQNKIKRYSVNGKKYIQLLHWWEHQQGQWAMPSKHPSPDGWDDRVRSYMKGVYHEDNWVKKGSKAVPQVDTPAGQSTSPPHVAGHDPDPDLDLDPDLNPDLDHIIINTPTATKSPQQKFIAQFLDVIGVQFSQNYGQDELKDLLELLDTYGDDRLIQVASWAADKGVNNMKHALASIRTSAARWKDKPQEKSFAERLAEA